MPNLKEHFNPNVLLGEKKNNLNFHYKRWKPLLPIVERYLLLIELSIPVLCNSVLLSSFFTFYFSTISNASSRLVLRCTCYYVMYSLVMQCTCTSSLFCYIVNIKKKSSTFELFLCGYKLHFCASQTYVLAIRGTLRITILIALRGRWWIEIWGEFYRATWSSFLFSCEVKHVPCLWFQEAHCLRDKQTKAHVS